MAYEPSEAAEFRQRLLTVPGERRDVEYKASVPLDADDSFTLKLLRHIQGMANGGGGWIVIGMSETNNGLTTDPAHSDDVSATYDPTRLSQMANSSVARGQQVDLAVYQEIHPATGQRHAVIRVGGISRVPLVCRGTREAGDTKETLLRQGAVYLRRAGAETSELSTVEDWDEIISRCVELRREELLREITEVFQRMTSPALTAPSSTARLQEFLATSRARAFGAGQ